MSEESPRRGGGLREHAAVLGAAKPGKRFVTYHEWRATRLRRRWVRTLYLTLSLLLIPIGLVMLVTPGPGLLALAVGFGLIAQASHRCARWLDSTEHWYHRRFRRRNGERSGR